MQCYHNNDTSQEAPTRRSYLSWGRLYIAPSKLVWLHLSHVLNVQCGTVFRISAIIMFREHTLCMNRGMHGCGTFAQMFTQPSPAKKAELLVISTAIGPWQARLMGDQHKYLIATPCLSCSKSKQKSMWHMSEIWSIISSAVIQARSEKLAWRLFPSMLPR